MSSVLLYFFRGIMSTLVGTNIGKNYRKGFAKNNVPKLPRF